MIEGPGRKKPPTSLRPGLRAGSSAGMRDPIGASARRGTAPLDGDASTESSPPTSAPQPLPPRDVARRTLEKLGKNVSARPAPEVTVEQRAGKTAALRLEELGSSRVGRAFAAIDLGSSSGKLLVQRLGVDGRLRTVVDRKIGAGLGKGVQNGDAIPEENQRRALDALASFLAEAGQHGVRAADIPVITTAVVRNANNGTLLVEKIHAFGLTRARTLSGDEEASVGFAGALAMMNGAPGRYATLDLGGGSFQLAVGSERGMDAGGSVQVGSNVILDTMIAPAARPDGAGDPAIFDLIDRRLEAMAAMPLDNAILAGRTLVATGGVSKFLRAHFQKDVISAREIDLLRREVIVLPHDARVHLVQGTKDEDTQKALGVDTRQGALDYGKKLPASASLLLHILESIGADEVRVSETDARHALVRGIVSAPEARSPEP